MNDTSKSKTPRATDERFEARGRRTVGRGRRAYWDNGRPARCMGRTKSPLRGFKWAFGPKWLSRRINWDGRDAKPAT